MNKRCMETIYAGLATVGMYAGWFLLALFIKQTKNRSKK